MAMQGYYFFRIWICVSLAIIGGVIDLIGQALPDEIYTKLERSGLQYFAPVEGKYNYYPGKDLLTFPYDFRLTKGGQSILVQIDENTRDHSPHIKFTRDLANLSSNSQEADIIVVSSTSEERMEYNAPWMLKAYFTPRGSYQYSQGKAISFYTSTGTIVTLVYLFNSDLDQEAIIGVKSLE